MTHRDPVLARLARLPVLGPSPEFSARLREVAHGRLRPRPVHRAWTVLVVAIALSYLGWAVHFTKAL